MKKLAILLLLISTVLASCSKKDNFDAAAQAATDDANIQAYIKTNNIAATKHSSGLYYQIVTEGTGINAVSSSTVTVNYTGKLLNGTTFDTGTAVSFSLKGVIQGWTIGIPLVKQGGRILLIIPSALAYANSSPSSSIPNNSVLVFTIDVLAVK